MKAIFFLKITQNSAHSPHKHSHHSSLQLSTSNLFIYFRLFLLNHYLRWNIVITANIAYCSSIALTPIMNINYAWAKMILSILLLLLWCSRLCFSHILCFVLVQLFYYYCYYLHFFIFIFIFIRLMHLLSLSTQLMCVIVSLGKSKDKKRSQQPKLRKGSEAEEIKIKWIFKSINKTNKHWRYF